MSKIRSYFQIFSTEYSFQTTKVPFKYVGHIWKFEYRFDEKNIRLSVHGIKMFSYITQ